MDISTAPFSKAKNYVFIGEAGCGKSEIAINLAYTLKQAGENVHFFDLDQTKPLFRSRDLRTQMESDGIVFHHEEQFYDAPTLASGISETLTSQGTTCVLDIGGNDTGSRVVGGFASIINREDTVVYFVINPYRPWSKSSNVLAETLNSIVWAARVQRVKVICNPNVGYTTTCKEVMDGIQKAAELLDSQLPIEFVTIPNALWDECKDNHTYPFYPLNLYLRYPWTQD